MRKTIEKKKDNSDQDNATQKKKEKKLGELLVLLFPY